tara:strand:+ start:458 stop:658 length:201 start_codon:yes stop_codon:yes gene_type:complete
VITLYLLFYLFSGFNTIRDLPLFMLWNLVFIFWNFETYGLNTKAVNSSFSITVPFPSERVRERLFK